MQGEFCAKFIMGYPDNLIAFCIAQNYDIFNAYD